MEEIWDCYDGACGQHNTLIEDCSALPGVWTNYMGSDCPTDYECKVWNEYQCVWEEGPGAHCVLAEMGKYKRCEGGAWVVIADPVYPDTGEFALGETDLAIPGRGLDYQFVRAYSSRGERKSSLGYNWDHNYNIFLTRPSSGTLVMSGGPVNVIPYYALGDGTYRSTLNYYGIIIESNDGSLMSRTPDGLRAYFFRLDGAAAAGKLARIVDRNGNTLRFIYDDGGRLATVIDTLGRSVDYQYDDAGYLTAIEDSMGRRVLFEIDEYGDLVTVTRLADEPGEKDRVTKYTYVIDATDPRLNHNLLAVTNPNETALTPEGPPAVVNTYETNPYSFAFDRVIQQEVNVAGSGCCGFDGVGTVTISYQLFNPNAGVGDVNMVHARTVFTDALGNVTEYYYNAAGGLLRMVEKQQAGLASSAASLVTQYTYNHNAEMVSSTDPEGRRTEYTYNGVNPDRLRQANLLNRKEIPAPGAGGEPLITAYAYDPVFNQMISETNPAGGTTFYTYDDAGNLLVVTNALGYTTTHTYNARGFRTSTTDANGHTTYFDEYYLAPPIIHDIAVTPTWGPTQTVFLFDASSAWDLEDTQAELQVRWDWEGDGLYDTPYTPVKTATHQYLTYGSRLVRVEVLDSDHLTATATGLVQVRPHLIYLPLVMRGYGTSTATWLRSPVLFSVESPEPLPPDGAAPSAASNVYRRTVATTDPLDHVTIQVYDAYGNLIEEIDANGHTTRYGYDTFNQLVVITDALGYTTHYVYDLDGNRTRVTDANGNHTDYGYDVRDQLVTITDTLGGITRYTYDANGNRTTETDANGHTTTHEYDEFDRLVTVTDPLGGETVYTYDANGNRTAETDANGHTTIHEYDGFDRLARTTDPLGHATEYTYDPLGNTTAVVDANGKATYQEYDALGRLVKEIKKVGDTSPVIDADDAVTAYTYDPVGNLLSMTEPNGNATTYAYDAVNRVISQANAAGETTAMAYDPAGNVVQITEFNGNVMVNAYDGLNRLVQVDDSLGRVAGYTYDPLGNRLTETDGNGNVITYAYAGLDRLTAVTDALGKTSTYTYDPMGNLVLATDRNGNATVQAYDALNRRVAITDALGFATIYGYDAVGNPTAITDANDHATHYAYDAVNRPITETYADGTRRTFTYDGVGNLLSRTDQNGATTRYEYDDLYFLTGHDYPTGPDDAFTYDKSGRMLSAGRNGWLVTYAYDGANRVIETTQDGQAVRYTYDVAHNTRTVFYPGGRAITETLDARGRLVRVHDGGPGALVGYVYDAGDRVVSRTYRNSVVAGYTYNANDWITRLEHRHGGDLLAGFAHGYDGEGNKLYAENLLPFVPAKGHTYSEKYDYDAIYRLVGFRAGQLVNGTVPTPLGARTWYLDPVGNWNQFTVDGVAYQNTPNQMNEYDDPSTDGPPPVPDDDGLPDDFRDVLVTPGADGFNAAHDKNGNLVDDGVHAYAYDYENRLVRVTRKADGQVMGEYRYDALGRRVVKVARAITETQFFYDDARVIEEQDAAGATEATYVYGTWIDDVLNMERGGEAFYYHQNAQGSVIGLTGGAGGVVERYAYAPYGSVTVSDGDGNPVVANPWRTPHSALDNPYLFTGRRLDEETGLYYYRARYYDSERGRFLQRDPVGYVDGMNLYAYAWSNPVYWMDSFGLWSISFRFNLSAGYGFGGFVGISASKEGDIIGGSIFAGVRWDPINVYAVTRRADRWVQRIFGLHFVLRASISGSTEFEYNICTREGDIGLCLSGQVRAGLEYRRRGVRGGRGRYTRQRFSVGASGQAKICVSLCSGRVTWSASAGWWININFGWRIFNRSYRASGNIGSPQQRYLTTWPSWAILREYCGS